MNEIYLLLIFLGVGLITGMLAGMFGLGGGVIFVPALYLLLPYTPIDINELPYIVIGTSLFAGSIASVSSGINHYLAHNVIVRRVILLSIGSVIAAFTAPFFVVDVKPFILKVIFAIVFVFVAINMIRETASKSNKKLLSQPIHDHYLILLGVFVGILAAFVGIGGGILFVPILLYLYNMEMKKAIGTSAFVTAFTMIASTITYTILTPPGNKANYQIGYIYLIAGVSMGLASAIGAYLGVKITLYSSGTFLKKVFSIFLIIVVIKILLDF